MILDERTEIADAASVANTAGASYLIGDQIPLSVVRDIGNGQAVYLVITCSTSIITAGAAGTISFSLVSDSSASIATNGTATVHWQSRNFVTDDDALNALDAGDIIACVALPLEGAAYEGFLGLLYTVTTTDTSAGAINAFLTLDPHGWQAYPEGTN